MTWILRFFWFVCAAVMLVNVAIWRERMGQLVARGTVTAVEVKRFTRGAAVWLAGIPSLLGVIALAAGWSDPLCAGVLSFRDGPSAATAAVLILAWAATLAWVWLGRGADLLARIGPALSKQPRYDRVYSPRLVRLVVTACILTSAAGAAFMWRQMPAADRGCLAAQLAGR